MDCTTAFAVVSSSSASWLRSSISLWVTTAAVMMCDRVPQAKCSLVIRFSFFIQNSARWRLSPRSADGEIVCGGQNADPAPRIHRKQVAGIAAHDHVGPASGSPSPNTCRPLDRGTPARFQSARSVRPERPRCQGSASAAQPRRSGRTSGGRSPSRYSFSASCERISRLGGSTARNKARSGRLSALTAAETKVEASMTTIKSAALPAIHPVRHRSLCLLGHARALRAWPQQAHPQAHRGPAFQQVAQVATDRFAPG